MKKIIPPITEADILRERLIQVLGQCYVLTRQAGNRDAAVKLWDEMIGFIEERSPSQVARMERDRGLL